MDVGAIIKSQAGNLKTNVDALNDYIEKKGEDGLDASELANIDLTLTSIINTAHIVRESIKNAEG